MAFTIYSIACVIFILIGLAMLWPINAASRRIKSRMHQLQHDPSIASSGTAHEREQP
jgi:Flp pilus assembly protein TadB